MEFLDHIHVKRGAIGLFHLDRCAGRQGTVVDFASGVQINDSELRHYAFVRFEDQAGATLFFDWIRQRDMVVTSAATDSH